MPHCSLYMRTQWWTVVSTETTLPWYYYFEWIVCEKKTKKQSTWCGCGRLATTVYNCIQNPENIYQEVWMKNNIPALVKSSGCAAAGREAETIWVTEECNAANLCKDFRWVSQQASTWGILRHHLYAGMNNCCPWRLFPPDLQDWWGRLPRRLDATVIPPLHGGQRTTGHYWHVPAEQPHRHSCSEGGCINRPGADVV